MLLSNPGAIDEQSIEIAIREGRRPRIQFSTSAASTREILEAVNACCHRFGSQIDVCFFGHYQTGMDLRVLEEIPGVRSLIIDVRVATHIESLARLPLLEELAIGFADPALANFLFFENLHGLRRLALLPTPKSNFDLAPLASYASLQDVTLCGHAKNIGVIAGLSTIARLGLSGIRSTVRLNAVSEMTGLRTLWVVLGGRSTTTDFAHSGIESLRIDRIRGLEAIDLARFPKLEQLCIEDQIKISTIDLSPLADQLRRLQIFNLKNLAGLAGLERQTRLEELWIGQTKLDPDSVIERLPNSVRSVYLGGYGAKRSETLKQKIQSRGLTEAKYVGGLGM